MPCDSGAFRCDHGGDGYPETVAAGSDCGVCNRPSTGPAATHPLERPFGCPPLAVVSEQRRTRWGARAGLQRAEHRQRVLLSAPLDSQARPVDPSPAGIETAAASPCSRDHLSGLGFGRERRRKATTDGARWCAASESSEAGLGPLREERLRRRRPSRPCGPRAAVWPAWRRTSPPVPQPNAPLSHAARAPLCLSAGTPRPAGCGDRGAPAGGRRFVSAGAAGAGVGRVCDDAGTDRVGDSQGRPARSGRPEPPDL